MLELLLRGLLFLGEAILGLIFGYFFYSAGWLLLRLLTLGRYPRLPLRQIDPAIEEAASDLGADQPTVFRTVILPLIRPAFISSMSYTFVRSMTAVSAIVFLISAKWYHITIQIYNFSENIRFGLASVLATALIFIVLAVFGLMRVVVKKSEHLEKTVTVQ